MTFRGGMVLLALLVAGCATAPIPTPQAATAPPERLTPYKLTAADIAAVQDGIRRILKDPDSARFGDMHAGTNTKGVIHVCLMVNAKNSYGGYAGMRPEIGILTDKPRRFVVVPDQGYGQEIHDQTTLKICDEAGLTLGL